MGLYSGQANSKDGLILMIPTLFYSKLTTVCPSVGDTSERHTRRRRGHNYNCHPHDTVPVLYRDFVGEWDTGGSVECVRWEEGRGTGEGGRSAGGWWDQ